MRSKVVSAKLYAAQLISCADKSQGTRKMLTYVFLVVIMSTIAGMIYGYLF